ncbi:D-amino-acid transaminase [Paenibacillus thailandensis]|uniref:D-alanine aminotransferase n=1 Tax=Paenibacillus thailandensis TaxID=393250 RepID=A0ABW5QVR5_9BACL
MSEVYYFRNEFLPKEDVRISPEDRGYYFGDGIYEVIRVYKGRMFEAKAHFERFKRTALAVRIPLPDMGELEAALQELIRQNAVEEGSVYVQMTRGTAPRAHNLNADTPPVVMAYCQKLSRPVDKMEKGIAAATVPDTRWQHCDLKTLNLLGNVLLKQKALDQGADDCILHRDGSVTECSSSNLFIVRDNRLVTHPADNLILPGITRNVVIRLAAELELPVEERALTVDELLGAQEVFLTSTVQEIVPIVTVDGKAIGGGTPGPVTQKLQQAFERLILA